MTKTEMKKYQTRYQSREKLKAPTFEVRLNRALVSTNTNTFTLMHTDYHLAFKVIIKKKISFHILLLLN